jgi:hypothetical protein
MSKQWSLWAFLSIFFPTSVVLGLHAYLGSFNRFVADDFCSAYYAERLGALRSVWFWYTTWFGGYAASLTDSILPLIGARGMAFTVFAILVIWSVLAILAVAAFWPKEGSRKDRTLAALSLGTAAVYLTLLVSPNVPQSLYWWGGMRGYIPPLLFFTLYGVLFQQFVAKQWSGKVLLLWQGLSFVIAFIGGGFSETFTPVQVVFFVLVIVFGLMARKFDFRSPTFKFLAIGLVGSTTALIVMIAAPGNANRQAFFPGSPNIFTILSISLTGYLAFLKDMVSTPDKIAGLVGMSAAASWWGLQSRPERAPKSWAAPAILLAGFIFAFGCFPSAAYGMSDVPPARTLVIPAYFLVIGLLSAGVIWGQWLTLRVETKYEFPVNLGLGISVTALILCSAWLNGQALYASRQIYLDYAVLWDRMNAQVMQAKTAGKESVTIPTMANWAGLDSPNDNPKFWLNFCYSKYYDINVLAPPSSY